MALLLLGTKVINLINCGSLGTKCIKGGFYEGTIDLSIAQVNFRVNFVK